MIIQYKDNYHPSNNKKEIILNNDITNIILRESFFTNLRIAQVSKYCYKEFQNLIKNIPLRKFIIEYCDHQSKTNPHLAYHIYKQKGENPKYLNHYSLKATLNIPYKKILSTILLSSTLTILLKNIHPFNPLSQILQTIIPFGIIHITTLVLLYKFNYYINTIKTYNALVLILTLYNVFL